MSWSLLQSSGARAGGRNQPEKAVVACANGVEQAMISEAGGDRVKDRPANDCGQPLCASLVFGGWPSPPASGGWPAAEYESNGNMANI